MRNGESVSNCGAWFGGDRETRSLVLWLGLSAGAAALIGCIWAIALLSGAHPPSNTVAVMPPLNAPLPAAVPISPGETAPSSIATAPDILNGAGAETARPQIEPPKPKRDTVRTEEIPPLPPPRPIAPLPPERAGVGLGDAFARASAHDPSTAVYDISAHTVTLPDGTRLEAHSGLGDLMDDPRSVSTVDRGATPPHLYELTPREEIFHGVQALRLEPIGEGDMFGRNGLLAHTYMLGPRGDSNGCVSFKDYGAFLKAYQDGRIKRLAVVARLN
jgi:hypothetical protein